MEQSLKLMGKVALVTGCMSGLGLETARLLLKQNLKGLILLDIVKNESILNELKCTCTGAEVMYRKCDVSNAQDLVEAYNHAWSHFGYIDVAVHSAGINNEDNSRRMVDVNVAGVIDGSMWLWNKMRKDACGDGGTIINISSITGILALPVAPIYSATKHAVRVFSECLGSSLHYDRTGVRVLTICPGATRTAMTTNPTRRIAEGLDEELKRVTGPMTFQKAESVAKVTLEVYENAPSGTVWISHRDQPAIQYLPKYEEEQIQTYFTS